MSLTTRHLVCPYPIRHGVIRPLGLRPNQSFNTAAPLAALRAVPRVAG